jgi:nucleotide-binding universal stress UspA family protein
MPVNAAMRIGSSGQAIAEYANELRCDQIVMGTRGLGSIGSLVLGSVATQVVHLTEHPVTLVK